MNRKPILGPIISLLACITLLAGISFFFVRHVLPAAFTFDYVNGGAHVLTSVGVPIGLVSTTEYLASTFFVPSVTVAGLQLLSQNADKGGSKVKILIVPGHEPDFGGAEYKNIKERDIVVKIGQALQQFFLNSSSDNRYDVTITRDTQDWMPVFKAYFAQEMPTINTWIQQHEQTMEQYVRNGSVTEQTGGVIHNDAPTDVADRLYMISKWADENDINITIHLHINDDPRADVNTPGKYSGFVVYVPEHQYSNAGATRVVADSVYKRLATYFPVSDFPPESNGVVEDQDLIAVGSHNTVDSVSMLIEYAYIYEPMLSTNAIQDVVTKELAYQTYLGVQDFFGKESTTTSAYANATLPYTWNTDIHEAKSGVLPPPSADVFALQMALVSKGYYPPAGKTKNECSMTAIIGPCTMEALSNFQKDNGVTGENFFGPKTRALFNSLFSGAQ